MNWYIVDPAPRKLEYWVLQFQRDEDKVVVVAE